MRVDELQPAPGSNRPPKRVGRGVGGKGGKTAGRGTKGQHARNTVAVGFEGGQMPLKQRVPKMKGFNNPFRVEYQAINLDTSGVPAQRAHAAVSAGAAGFCGRGPLSEATAACSRTAAAPRAPAARSTRRPGGADRSRGRRV